MKPRTVAFCMSLLAFAGPGWGQGRAAAPAIPHLPPAMPSVPAAQTPPTPPSMPMIPVVQAPPSMPAIPSTAMLRGSPALPAAIPTAVRPGTPGVLPPAAANAADGHGSGFGRSQAEAAATSGTSRAQAQQALVKANPKLLDMDPLGNAIVRGQVLAIAPSAQGLESARRLGFTVGSPVDLGDLGLKMVLLVAPMGQSASQGIDRLRATDPDGIYDFNHLYAVVSSAERTGAAPLGTPGARRRVHGVRIGLIDAGALAAHPTLGGVHIEQKGFAPGGVVASRHGTAVASLIAGDSDRFSGEAPGSDLYIADVYGNTAAGGSALAVVQALGWLTDQGVPVINVSLVGPRNALLDAALKAVVGRGVLVVAAVGNDGPASPPLYPAAYAGVVGVTAVDSRDMVILEAVRGPQVLFAAPGADMNAADLGTGYSTVRGTSFAAPIVAARLATLHRKIGLEDARLALSSLEREAKDLGPKGRDDIYGYGLIGDEIRPQRLAGPPEKKGLAQK